MSVMRFVPVFRVLGDHCCKTHIKCRYQGLQSTSVILRWLPSKS